MFYEQGIKTAFEQLGMDKEAFRAMSTLWGAGRGALAGGGIGGVTGALSADEGQRWQGFTRGLGRGALVGGALGGVSGLRKGMAIHKRLGPEGAAQAGQMMRANTTAGRQLRNLATRETQVGKFVPGLGGGLAGLTGSEA